MEERSASNEACGVDDRERIRPKMDMFQTAVSTYEVKNMKAEIDESGAAKRSES